MIKNPLKILLFTNALILTASAMLGPIIAIFVDDIGGSILDASIAGGIFAFVAGMVTYLSGKFSDEIKEARLFIALGYGLIAFGFGMYIFVNNTIALFITQAVIGLGEAIYSPAFDKLYSDHISKNNSGKDWGVWESMNYFTQSIGALIGGLIAVYFSFDILFIIMSLLSVFSTVYILLVHNNIL